ncbi:MAG TPA: DUF2339 domain-containing protein, partial [Burkholderiaceae bacterium]|nr:DUF2339 domain-containing protein [Burkholderiaceae bacterium]
MLSFIAIVIGGVIGAAWADAAFGGVIGALAGWLSLRSWQHQRQIDALQQALVKLQAGGARAAPGAAPMPVRTAPVETAPAPRVPAAESAPVKAPIDAPTVASGVAPTVAVTAPSAPRTPVPVLPRPDPLAPIKAWLFGGNTIVKAGVGILFIGLAFLAKYASEHVQVPVEFRLAGIGGVALVLLVLGWRLRTRRAQYAQILQGGAIAVLYLTLFAAFKFYNVLAVGPAFALMVVVAALAAALAVLQDARSLAVIGALGGFATPLLVSSGGGNQVALFGYYLVLDLGIAAVAWFRTWRSLNLIGFLFTFVVGTAWGVLDYSPAH